MSVKEYEASLIVRSGAELLRVASSDPRSDEGYKAVKANVAGTGSRRGSACEL
jgi:hypothetical protein